MPPKSDPPVGNMLHDAFAQLGNSVKVALQDTMNNVARDQKLTCTLSGCGTLSVGWRCDQCSRKLCIGHTYWSFVRKKVLPYCPYCVLQQSSALFADDADEGKPGPEESGDGGVDGSRRSRSNPGSDDADIIDAEVVEDD